MPQLQGNSVGSLDCSRCRAVVWRAVRAEIRRPRRLDVADVVAATVKVNRCVALVRVIGCPFRLGISADMDANS